MVTRYLVMMLSIILSRSSALKLHRCSLGLLKTVLVPGSYISPNSATTFSTRQFGSAKEMSGKIGNYNEIDSGRSMEDRINEAKKWVSYKLSDTESERLNKALGIEQEVMEAMKQGDRIEKKKEKANFFKIKGLELNNEQAKLKGFLQVNPVICSGCGTAFQTKSPDNPGNLHSQQ